MEVNDYVRTEINGIDIHIQLISKIKEMCDGDLIFTTNGYWGKEQIKKSSPNIIDLIEVGDYVNGYKVLNVLDFNDNSKMISLEKIYDNKIAEEDIKSIVTKEQFESMEYKVKE